MSIKEQTEQEHKQLLQTIEEVTRVLSKFRVDILWPDVGWMPDSDLLNFLEWQGESLGRIKESVLLGHYREAYNDLRMVFEAYLLLILITICDKYTKRYSIRRQPGDRDLAQAKERCLTEISKVIRGGARPDVVRIYQTGKDSVTLVLRGIPVVDSDSKPTGAIVPIYSQAWVQYRPDHHVQKGYLKSSRFLVGQWEPLKNMVAKAQSTNNAKLYADMYREFFTFDKMIEKLRLNGILNKKTATRAVVHYNFLSGYSHTTHEAFKSLQRSFAPLAYDHYHSELCLLYIVHLLSMHLVLAIRYFRWRRIKVRNQNKTYRRLCKIVDEAFGYFWFIFNKPHDYDRFDTANRKSDPNRGLILRPEDIPISQTRYYENPLERLRALHTSVRELTTGNFYQSPFPRKDALFK